MMSEFTTKPTHSELRICVDQINNGCISGRVAGRRLSHPLSFQCIDDLILQIEEVLELQNFPQAFQEKRTFQPSHRKSPAKSQDAEIRMDEEAVLETKGVIATFHLFINTRCHATWQGRLDWLDGTTQQCFSSDLELINLIDTHPFR